MAYTYTQLDAQAVFSVEGRGNFIARTMHKTTPSLQDFCCLPIVNTTITTCQWHFARRLSATIGESGAHLKSHSDVIMVAKVDSLCSKSRSDSVFIMNDNLD